MCNILQVRWTIIPKTAPQPWRTCSGCGGPRAFQSSDKIRLNANGRKLDAWLIYKCMTCDKTWNRPIFERQNVRDLNPVVLQALHSNDPEWIRAEAFNLEDLRRRSQRIDEFAPVEIYRKMLTKDTDWDHVEIELAVPLPTSMRLDRLLASELNISRARLAVMHENNLLRTNSDRPGILRRRIKSELLIIIDLSRCTDRDVVWKHSAITGSAD